jgi:tRNA modification GTPase
VDPDVLSGMGPVFMASLVHDGLPSGFMASLSERLCSRVTPEAHAVISERHRAAAAAAAEFLRAASAQLDAAEEDRSVLAAESVRSALETLGEITGRVYHTELLDRVFSRFCIGK